MAARHSLGHLSPSAFMISSKALTVPSNLRRSVRAFGVQTSSSPLLAAVSSPGVAGLFHEHSRRS